MEKAAKLVLLVRTTATGGPATLPTLPATPPTLARAGQAPMVTTSPCGVTVMVTVSMRAVTPFALTVTVAVKLPTPVRLGFTVRRRSAGAVVCESSADNQPKEPGS